jgi:enoyl-CoA hydratase/carnithine racemase
MTASNDQLLVRADDQDARVLIVTLNRAAQRNAMSDALVDRMLALLDDRSGMLRDIGAIVLTGAGTGFCAGSDLAGLAGMTGEARSAFEDASGRLARALTGHPLPIVAAVAGFAIGGGLTLAAACDVVVTTPAARWSLPEVPIGLFPAWGLEAVVNRVGRARAREISWGIDSYDGTAAVAMGLADRLADDPFADACTIARKLAALPAISAAGVKAYFSAAHTPEDGDRMANAIFMDSCASSQAAALFARFAKGR